MIMRTTQKDMMSKPAMSTELGRNTSSSRVFPASRAWSGKSTARRRTRCRRTSGSCLSVKPAGLPDFRTLLRTLRATTMLSGLVVPRGNPVSTRAGVKCTSRERFRANGCRSRSSGRG